MAYDMSQFGESRWVKTHPDGVYTHGSMEPVLSVLDVRGFEVRDLFLIGFNDSCGTIVLPDQSRAENAAAALEPAFTTRVYLFGNRDGEDVWATDYTRRALDGTTLLCFITDLTLKDGTVAIRDGRWVR
ncbi:MULTISPECIES: hypothetical protein [unclassified Streptomyces]|uniref:hypothetical protein n=1 Tax=unclassified Streptomyces TaxID=2593676 RepID=UPI001BECC074|nr:MULTISPECIES: hypothetical protein [unclassified Streptomyces]MBT2406250.1 hypothetical protein [Streptomyces sp. ISL-21]MBT2607433.1 hypothetical protein [Streptomyces sp. ISL-87]